MNDLSEFKTKEKKLIKKYGDEIKLPIAVGRDYLSLDSFLKAKLPQDDYETATSIAFWMFADSLDSITPPKRNPARLFDEVLAVSAFDAQLYQPK